MAPMQKQKIALQLVVALCLSNGPLPVLPFTVGDALGLKYHPPIKSNDPSRSTFVGRRCTQEEGCIPTIQQHHSCTCTCTRLFSSQTSDAIIEGKSNNKNSSINDTSAEDKANQLREKARALRLEATAAEQNLRTLTQQKKELVKKEADEYIDLLLGTSATSSSESSENNGIVASNNNVPASQTLALRIKEHTLYSASKLLNVVERLHDRETSMMVGPEGYLSKLETAPEGEVSDSGGGFVLGDFENNSLEYKKEEIDKISGLLDRILEAVQILDDQENGSMALAPKLRIRVSDLRQARDALLRRRVDNLTNNFVDNSSPRSKSRGIDGYVQSSIDGENDDPNNNDGKKSKEDRMLERLIETPQWLPSQLASFAATSPVEVSVSHWKMIKAEVMADSEFICTSWDSTDVAAVYRGRLPRVSNNNKSSTAESENGKDESETSIATIFNELQTQLEKHSELKDRVQLFLVVDNEWLPSYDSSGNYRLDEMKEGPPPVIIALAKEAQPEQETERGLGIKSLGALSTLLTAGTTLTYALSSFALNPTFFNAVVKENDITPVPLSLPIFFGVLAISAMHEAAHLVAAKSHDVKLGTPVPLPSLQVGTFGTITPLRSFPPSRTALFDVAISGPLVSMLVSLILIASGLSLTLTSQSITMLPVVPAATFKSSFLIGSIASIVAPKVMMLPLSQPIPVHPLFLVGLAGLVMSAVNLLPIGRLDGGRACMAAWGRRSASLISFTSLATLTFYSFSGLSGIIIFWGAIVTLTQRLPDIPAVDEYTKVGDIRANIYMVLVALAIMTLAPFPGGVGPI